MDNRAKMIRSNLNQAVSDLRSQHKDLELETRVASSNPTLTDYQTRLFWIPSCFNTSDMGSKYRKIPKVRECRQKKDD